MRALVQRVTEARVRVDGQVIGEIGPGLCCLVGVTHGDDRDAVVKLAAKLWNLRIFADEKGHMNRPVADNSGELMVVSQFTLYGDTRKGRRPSFIRAAGPDVAVPLYESFVTLLRDKAPGRVETGVFGAMMDVELVNDGPVTLVLER